MTAKKETVCMDLCLTKKFFDISASNETHFLVLLTKCIHKMDAQKKTKSCSNKLMRSCVDKYFAFCANGLAFDAFIESVPNRRISVTAASDEVSLCVGQERGREDDDEEDGMKYFFKN